MAVVSWPWTLWRRFTLCIWPTGPAKLLDQSGSSPSPAVSVIRRHCQPARNQKPSEHFSPETSISAGNCLSHARCVILNAEHYAVLPRSSYWRRRCFAWWYYTAVAYKLTLNVHTKKLSAVSGVHRGAHRIFFPGGHRQSLQRGPGAESLVKGSGGKAPPEAESILVIGCPTEPANLAPFQNASVFLL